MPIFITELVFATLIVALSLISILCVTYLFIYKSKVNSENETDNSIKKKVKFIPCIDTTYRESYITEDAVIYRSKDYFV